MALDGLQDSVYGYSDHEASLTLGRLVARDPRAARVLMRYGMNFCSNREQRLVDACRQMGIPVRQVVQELSETCSAQSHASWEEAPLNLIVSHIIRVYHVPLREELSQLSAMSREIQAAHTGQPRLWETISGRISNLTQQLFAHLYWEELALFPAIIDQDRNEVVRLGEALNHDHQIISAHILQTRRAIGALPRSHRRCDIQTCFLGRVANLFQELREHASLEEDVIIPRVMG